MTHGKSKAHTVSQSLTQVTQPNSSSGGFGTVAPGLIPFLGGKWGPRKKVRFQTLTPEL